MKRFALIKLLFFFSSLLFGQKATYEASLGEVDSTGFYAVPLKPRLTQYLDLKEQKIRLFENGKEKPFIIGGAQAPEQEMEFKEFPIQEVKRRSGERLLILEAPEDRKDRPFILYTKEADSLLQIRIEGKQKETDWEEVKGMRNIHSSVKDTNTAEFRLPRFLKSEHTFYRIRIRNGSNKAPKIVSFGWQKEKSKGEQAYWDLPTPKFRQKEGKEKSYIGFWLDTARWVDRVVLELDGPPFFRRLALLGVPKHGVQAIPYPRSVIGSKILTDSSAILENLERTRSQHFLLSIEKGPDPPLKVEKVRCFQKKRFLIAHFEKGSSYQILLGPGIGPAPKYELENYRDRIPDGLPLLQLGGISSDVVSATKEREKGELIWMWMALIIAIIVLGTLSYGLLQKAGNSNTSS